VRRSVHSNLMWIDVIVTARRGENLPAKAVPFHPYVSIDSSTYFRK